MNPLLKVQNLNILFESNDSHTHVVRGVNFSLFKGEALGIVGESGCGKSALAKSIMQLLPPYSKITGEIFYRQENLLAYTDARMQQIRQKDFGMIFQDPMTTLNPTMKVGVQIMESYKKAFPFASHKCSLKAVMTTITQLGVQNPHEFISAYPHSLSGGMRQKVMIAIALIKQPELLLADEPTTALDATNRIRILKALKKEQTERGLSILLISHDLNLISYFCDQIIVMYAGKIVEYAPTQSLFSRPQHPYTQGLIKSIPNFNLNRDHPLNTIEGVPPNLNDPLQHCSFCLRCPHAMNICAMQIPQLYQINGEGSHYSACFKNDPRYSV
jgi:oligopeptide transport system ATP-binding protein